MHVGVPEIISKSIPGNDYVNKPQQAATRKDKKVGTYTNSATRSAIWSSEQLAANMLAILLLWTGNFEAGQTKGALSISPPTKGMGMLSLSL